MFLLANSLTVHVDFSPRDAASATHHLRAPSKSASRICAFNRRSRARSARAVRDTHVVKCHEPQS
jgi:hypothetical protein